MTVLVAGMKASSALWSCACAAKGSAHVAMTPRELAIHWRMIGILRSDCTTADQLGRFR